MSRNSISDLLPGVRRYLEASEEDRLTFNQSRYNAKARDAADWAIRYLILFSQRQKEKEIAKVLDSKKARVLAQALLGMGCPVITERHYELAKAMLDTAVRRLNRLIDENYRPYIMPSMERDRMLFTFLPTKQTENPSYVHQREQMEKELVSVSVTDTAEHVNGRHKTT